MRDDGDFDRWLDQELRRTMASVRGPSPRASQAAYRAAAGPRGRPAAARPALLGRGAFGLMVAALALGAASAVAAGTGSQIPAELARSASQIVHGCWAGEGAGGQTASRAGACAASPLDHDQGATGQKPGGGSDTGSEAGRAGPPAAHGSRGQGGGSTGPPGQGHGGGSGAGTGQAGRPSPEPSDHGHHPSDGARTTR
ncbi:MAG TPA: hypothetical protein VKF59_00115 [Candidatus Dormibacteraeota bacterium]|nr:hypothetical protein [Candidatus Dormibacteraeota bacterium]